MIKNRLKEIIDEKNINVSQMADSIGISRSSFYELYKDNASFKNETWTKIANYLHLSINDLIYSVSDEVSISLVKILPIDSFPKKENLYVGSFIANFYNKYYAINIDVPISFKIVFDKDYIFVYYDYIYIGFDDKPFFDNILDNDNNLFYLFNFMYDNFISKYFTDFNLPYAFIRSLNGSSVEFASPYRSSRINLFYPKLLEEGFIMESNFDENMISELAFKCIRKILGRSKDI